MKRDRLIFIAIFLLALFVRSAGLFRGLEAESSFHPDAAKQVVATHNYLRGHYLWYTGSLAYDGYPYGLNHVDEWIIRATWPAATAILHTLQPALDLHHTPSLETLYYLCRALRVLYSLLAWGLFAWILSRCSIARPQQFMWLLLAALAPVATIVTHSATGDVGTDLFVMLALAFLIHTRDKGPNPFLFGSCGFALGCAFACKYHGVLGGLTPALFLLLAPLPWRKRIGLGIATFIGAIAGFLALTPHTFIAPGRTLKLIGQNFVYIQNYGVSGSFLKLPLLERLTISLTSNVPVVFDSLGFAVISIALLALLFGAWRILRARNTASALDFAIIAMPFGVLAASLVGKPALQSFHFSFLILPFLLGSALIWHTAQSRVLRVVLPLLLAVSFGEYALKQKHDLFFWPREDTIHIAQRLSKELLEPDSDTASQIIARLAVEDDNRAVFRNRPAEVRLADAADWKKHPRDSVPATPWDGGPDWIFADLPAFPRETRLLPLPAGRRVKRAVITAQNKDLPLTLYAGEREAEVRIKSGATTQNVRLAPFEVQHLTIPASEGVAFSKKTLERHRYTLLMRARGAPVLLRVGAEPDTLSSGDRITRKMSRSQFLEGTFEQKNHRILRNTYLLPGVYSIKLDAPPEAPIASLKISDSLLPHPDRERHFPLRWSDGSWRAEWKQTTLLHRANFTIETSGTMPGSSSWKILPVGAIAPDPSPAAGPADWKPAFSFNRGSWTLGNLTIPTRLKRGKPFSIETQLATTLAARERLRDYSLFVHLLNDQNKQVFAADVPLLHIPSAHSGLHLAQHLGALELEPGNYTVAIGIYYPRSGQRLEPDSPAPPLRGKRINAGTLQIE